MNILSTRPKKRKRRQVMNFMGTYVPKVHHDYVTMYCNAHEVSKTNIIRMLVSDWCKSRGTIYDINALELIIAKKAHVVWKNTEGKSFGTFLFNLTTELKQKKFEKDQIERIIKMVEDEENSKEA